ncbi:unnamed protein product, partial [Porites evermanni]
MQEDKLFLYCAAKKYLRRMSVLGHHMWTQHWLIMDIQEIDRKAQKIVIENGGRCFYPRGLISGCVFYLQLDGPITRGLINSSTPSAPYNLKSSLLRKENPPFAVKLSWNQPDENGGMPVLEYSLEYKVPGLPWEDGEMRETNDRHMLVYKYEESYKYEV